MLLTKKKAYILVKTVLEEFGYEEWGMTKQQHNRMRNSPPQNPSVNTLLTAARLCNYRIELQEVAE